MAAPLGQIHTKRYAYFVNRAYNHSGTMWKGRHKARAIDTENYLLKCYHYIGLNPVAADMINRPEVVQG